MEGTVNDDADRRYFEEATSAKDIGERVVIGGAELSRHLEIVVVATGKQFGAARRLHDALFEALPPSVFHELREIFNTQKDLR